MRAARAGIGRLASTIFLLAALAFLVIALAITIVLLGANPANAVVRALTAVARFLVGPFEGLFTFRDPDVAIAVNWGIAAVVWYALGRLLARIVAP